MAARRPGIPDAAVGVRHARHMARVDYYNDPNAPKANRLVPSVTAAVRDDDGRLLLVHRADYDDWALPGGVMNVGESIADAVIRGVAEETGLKIEITGVVGVYTDPHHVTRYEDGEVHQELSVCFHARLLGERPGEDTTGRVVSWVEPSELEELPIHPATRIRINDALSDRARPRIA
jgi:ADP-ribose pyrophosphatase YjhB (NUDIX family)